MRASFQPLFIVRVPRAQETIGLPLHTQGSVSFLFPRRVARPSPIAAVERASSISFFQAYRLSHQGWGLIDLRLRASNEHILIVRVARAQEINSLHPPLLLRKHGGWPSHPPPIL